jgi:hypothetical protein
LAARVTDSGGKESLSAGVRLAVGSRYTQPTALIPRPIE